jgi:penicillin amidase
VYQPLDDQNFGFAPRYDNEAKQAKTDQQLVYLTYLTVILCTIIIILQMAFVIFVAVITAKSTPRYNGKFPVALSYGLSAQNTPPIIDRDENQVIHITAQNDLDLFYAQGIAMAQERLFQMDLQRRVGKGLVSEIVGSGGLGIDKMMRSLNILSAVRKDLNNATTLLSTETIQKLQKFVDGINAYIENDPPLTIEFWLLKYTPTKFQVEDVLVNIKVLAWTLDGNLNSEITRYIMTMNGISLDRINNVLFPSYPAQSPTIINSLNTLSSNPAARKLSSFDDPTLGAYQADDATVRAGPYKVTDNSDMDRFLPGVSHSTRSVQASNNWVIGGKLTDSGMPMLACDTHLSISALGHFLLMHLRVDTNGDFSNIKSQYDIDVIGAAIVGVPTIVLGRNGNGVAWGMTNVGADVKDFFVLDETDAKDGYMVDGVKQVYSIRNEIVKVKDSADVIVQVKESQYGPVMNTALGLPGTKPMALKWMGTAYVGDRTVETFISLMRVANWAQFKDAFRGYVGPAQNFIFADAQNNIGYLLPGQFPTRIGEYSGMYPVEGNGKYDWAPQAQNVPYDSLPSAYLSASTQALVAQPYFFSANNKAFPDNAYPFTIASDWLADDYRAVRIGQLIYDKTRGRNMMFSDMEEMQLDTKSSIYQRHRNILDRMGPFTEGKFAFDIEIFRLKLLNWNGETSSNKETTVFEEWIFNLATLAGKEVNLTFVAPSDGQDPSILELQRFFSHRYIFGVIDAEVRGANISTEPNCVPYGGCLNFARQMFALSVTDLKERFGNVPTWGEMIHWTTFDHPVFSKVAALQCIACRRVFTSGGSQTLNVAPPNLGMYRFASNFGPTYRQLIDLKNPDNSLFIAPMGQSGNLLSKFYDGYLKLWKKGLYVPMRMRGYYVQSRVSFS